MIFKGCGTALVTPFRNGAVDYEAYSKLIERQVDGGVDFLVPLATTGETPTLSAEEKLKLLEITYEKAVRKDGSRLPLLVGCGSNAVGSTLENMKLLDGPMVDGWLVVVPFYNKPTQEGQFQYFKAIAAETSKPVVVYNVPGRTGANMLPQTCLRIAAACPNVVGIKEASGKIEQAEEIINGAPEGFAVLSGDDDLTLAMMKKGGAGVISVASNIKPAEVSDMVHLAASSRLGDAAAKAARLEEAAAKDAALAPLYKACFVESNPIPAKAALSILGLCTDEMRLPLVPASEATRSLIKEILN